MIWVLNKLINENIFVSTHQKSSIVPWSGNICQNWQVFDQLRNFTDLAVNIIDIV